MVIETEFDGLLEDDVIFEETDQQLDLAETLKNSENIMKAFLYIKKIVDSSSPFVNAVIKVSTIDTTLGKEEYVLDINTGKVLLKNISTTDSYSLFFNDGEFVLFPYESVELPVTEITKLETVGRFSIIESEYKLGKG